MRAKWNGLIIGGIAAAVIAAGLYGLLRTPSERWREYRIEDGGYRVRIPTVRGRVPTADCGTNGDLKFCMFHTDHSHLGVTFHQDPGAGNAVADNQAARREAADQGGELVGEIGVVIVDGVSGIDYSIRTKDGNSIRTRAFHHQGRFVEIRGVSRNASEPEASRAEAEAFVISLRFAPTSQ